MCERDRRTTCVLEDGADIFPYLTGCVYMTQQEERRECVIVHVNVRAFVCVHVGVMYVCVFVWYVCW